MTDTAATAQLPGALCNDVVAIESIPAVPTILDVVCRTTGMGFAAVARVTEDHWVACAVRDEIAFGLKPGGELDVETTICHEIRQSGTAVVINHVAEDPGFYRHHTPAKYGFQSYISMPIVLPDGTFFGTLCAIDLKPAKLNTPAVVDTFKMFADLIGFHLDANQRLASRTAERDLYENIVQSDTAPICVFDTEYRLIAFNRAHNHEFFRVNGLYSKIGDVFPDLRRDSIPCRFPVPCVCQSFSYRDRGEGGVQVEGVVEEHGPLCVAQALLSVGHAGDHDHLARLRHLGAAHFVNERHDVLAAGRSMRDYDSP